MPVLESFRKWLEEQKKDVLPKSPINAAIGYVQNHWEALIRYASSGYLAIDNNVSEQHMKTIATGRKNWLFTGSEEGGKTMAVLFSVVSSCQRHGHDPFAYLRDVLGACRAIPRIAWRSFFRTAGRPRGRPMPRWAGLGAETLVLHEDGAELLSCSVEEAFSLIRAFRADVARGVGPRYHRSAGLVGPYGFRDAFRDHGPGITNAVSAREHESWQGPGWGQR